MWSTQGRPMFCGDIYTEYARHRMSGGEKEMRQRPRFWALLGNIIMLTFDKSINLYQAKTKSWKLNFSGLPTKALLLHLRAAIININSRVRLT